MPAEATPLPAHFRLPVVYALLDEAGAVLYVGSSNRLASRLATHRRQRENWADVRYVTWIRTTYGSRFVAEMTAIRSLAPPWNVTGRVQQNLVEVFAQRRRERLARAAEFPDVRSLRRPDDRWIEAIATGRAHLLRQALVVSAAPISRWERAA